MEKKLIQNSTNNYHKKTFEFDIKGQLKVSSNADDGVTRTSSFRQKIRKLSSGDEKVGC